MINHQNYIKMMNVLIEGTKKDKIIWENTMLNIHETKLYGKRIFTDWERDEAPMISIDESILQLNDDAIGYLRQRIDEQYKRLKKYRYSTPTMAQAAQAAAEQLQNDKNFDDIMKELLETVNNNLTLEERNKFCEKCGKPK